MSVHNILSVKDLSVTFKPRNRDVKKAVFNLSFDIKKGETFGLVGESGSGKSVTSLAIMGLLPEIAEVTSSSINLAGDELSQKSEAEMRSIRGKKIAMIFQDPMTSLNPLVTVGEQIAEPIRIHQGLGRHDAKVKALELLEKVALNPAVRFYRKYPHELSGGQQQRVMIAMAISSNPDLLIADEPTTALDVTIQKQVVELLKSLQEEFSMGLLFITHDLALVANIADRIGVMRHGKLVEIAATPMLFKHPKEPYTKGLIACRPPMDSKPRRLPTVESFLSGPTASLSDQTLTLTSKRLASETSNNEPVLVIENVSKYYFKKSALIKRFSTPFKAVDQVNLSIQKGINFGLVGESGCGKTTLARLMVGLNEPTHGAIYYKGQDLASLSRQERLEVRKKVQYIFQNPYAALNPKFTIEQTLIEPMQVHHIGSHYKDRRDRAAELLDMVGLAEDMLSRYPHQFSGGQRQRICIARALSLDPELIVCDESVSALDVSIQAQILNLLLDIQEKKGVTYVFISHDLGVVKFFADRLAVMKDGKIVESGASDKVYRKPEHPFTKTLLSSIPTVERFSESL